MIRSFPPRPSLPRQDDQDPCLATFISVAIVVICSLSDGVSQVLNDTDQDGVLKLDPAIVQAVDVNGSGVLVMTDKLGVAGGLRGIHSRSSGGSLEFSQFWVSPVGAFTNCWDGAAGYFDDDTLLDVAGYTFSPNMFYVWEQSTVRPDSFVLVASIPKGENGGFGPMVVGDTDGDGKSEIILADFSTLSRIYVYENDGNNVYVSQNTQGTLTHPTDPIQSAQALLIGDLNRNGKKEIILVRAASSPTTSGMLRIWEQTGPIGSNTYANIYTYNTVSYLFGKSGIGDSDGDGYDEVFLSYGGLATFQTNIRRIEYDSTSASFQHLLFGASSIGLPTSYLVVDVNNDGQKELIYTANSNNAAACFVYRSTGTNQYQKVDSIFEPSDGTSMLVTDARRLTGRTYPTILLGSFGGKMYMYEYNGTSFSRQYENLNFSNAVRRVRWLPWIGQDGFFNTLDLGSSAGNFFLYRRTDVTRVVETPVLPLEIRLFQNYPNPFNPATKISFRTTVYGWVGLNVCDVLGHEVATLVNERLVPGRYEVTFVGSGLASGVYFCRLSVRAGEHRGVTISEQRKLLLLR